MSKSKQPPGLLLGIAGYAQTGKDTLASIITKKLGPGITSKIYKFAEEVREEAARKNPDIPREHFWSTDPEIKSKIRPILVEIGGGYRENDPGIWIRKLKDSIEADEGKVQLQIVTDVRYINELTMLTRKGGHVIILNRHGFGPANDEEAKETSPLYDTARNPYLASSLVHPHWWTHELNNDDSPFTEKEREAWEWDNLLKTLPLLKQLQFEIA